MQTCAGISSTFPPRRPFQPREGEASCSPIAQTEKPRQKAAPSTHPRAAFLLSTVLLPQTYRPGTLDRQGQYGEEPNEKSF